MKKYFFLLCLILLPYNVFANAWLVGENNLLYKTYVGKKTSIENSSEYQVGLEYKTHKSFQEIEWENKLEYGLDDRTSLALALNLYKPISHKVLQYNPYDDQVDVISSFKRKPSVPNKLSSLKIGIKPKIFDYKNMILSHKINFSFRSAGARSIDNFLRYGVEFFPFKRRTTLEFELGYIAAVKKYHSKFVKKITFGFQHSKKRLYKLQLVNVLQNTEYNRILQKNVKLDKRINRMKLVASNIYKINENFKCEQAVYGSLKDRKTFKESGFFISLWYMR